MINVKQNICALIVIATFASLIYSSIFFSGKTISAYDLCFFEDVALKGSRPANLEHPSNPLLSDPVGQYQPWDIIAFEGPLKFPWLWNPYAGCGAPLLANGQSSLFFPLKYIAYIFGVREGFGVLCFLKCLCAGLLMWWYLGILGLGNYARVIGAMSFMGCAYMIVWIQYSLTSAALFLPLFFVGFEYTCKKKYKVGLLIVTMATALSLLGGHPETTFFCVVGLLIYAVGHLIYNFIFRHLQGTELIPVSSVPIFVTVITGVLLGALVSAIQILPLLEYIWNSYEFYTRSIKPHYIPSFYPFGLQKLICLIIPDAFGTPLDSSVKVGDLYKFTNYNEFVGYVGAGILLLGIAAWAYIKSDSRIFSFLILQLFCACFLTKIPLISPALSALPLFNVANHNRLIMLLFPFGIIVQASIIFDRLYQGIRPCGIKRIWFFLSVLLCISLSAFYFFTYFHMQQDVKLRTFILKNLFHCLICLIPWIGVYMLANLKMLARNLFAAFLVVLLAVDITSIYAKYNPSIASSAIYRTPEILRPLQKRIVPARVLPVLNCIHVGLCSVFGINDAQTYDTLEILWQDKFLDQIGIYYHFLPNFDNRLASIASMQYIWAPLRCSPHFSRIHLLSSDGFTSLYENLDALPRAFISENWYCAPTYEAAWKKLLEKSFPWKEQVVVESPMVIENASNHAISTFRSASISVYKPDYIEISLPEASQGLLVLNDAFYPGWHASVDGQPAALYRVNTCFRGVFVQPHNHKVVFSFKPTSFYLGIYISFITFLCLCMIVIWRKRPVNL